jgi:large subunit ribosomal protein L21
VPRAAAGVTVIEPPEGSMYAVIETGGKQYRVEVGTELAVELLDAEPGQEITLDRVLLVADDEEAAIGRPVVDGAAVRAAVVGTDRGDKVISFKYRPKARRRVKKGHRQDYTILRITDVVLGDRSAAAELASEEERKARAQEEAEQEAAARAAADAALAAKLAERAKAAEEAAGAEARAAESARKPRRRPKAAAPAPETPEEDEATGVDAEVDAAAPSAGPEAVEPGGEATRESAPDAETKPARARGSKKEG